VELLNVENNKSKSNNQHICVMLMLHSIDIVSHSRHSTTFKEANKRRRHLTHDGWIIAIAIIIIIVIDVQHCYLYNIQLWRHS
jgi:hypothetical protein